MWLMEASERVRSGGGNGPPTAVLVSWLIRASIGLLADEGGRSSSLQMARAHLISSSKPETATHHDSVTIGELIRSCLSSVQLLRAVCVRADWYLADSSCVAAV